MPNNTTDQEALFERARQIYQLTNQLPRLDCNTSCQMLPSNGIYLFFEQSETVTLNESRHDRIVRVGTHKSDGRFPTRIYQHYGVRSSFNGNKNGSVFRKHLGGALMRKANLTDSRLSEWIRQNGASDPAMEIEVSQYLRKNCTFVCFIVPEKTERLSLEAGLIALLAKYNLCIPSSGWLGQYAAAPEIRHCGLWNIQHVAGVPLTATQLSRIDELITLTLNGGEHA